MRHVITTLLVALLAGTAPATAGARKWHGPYPAQVLRVVDGDTLELRMAIYPGLKATDMARLAGVDTPEVRRPAPACERELGRRATELVQSLVDDARQVQVYTAGREKYGRQLVRVELDGQDLATALIAAGLGRPYHGERREGWCP